MGDRPIVREMGSHELASLARIREALVKRGASKKDLKEVDRAIAILERAPPQHHPRLAVALGVVNKNLRCFGDEEFRGKSLSPTYPNIPIQWQARIVLGESPADLSADPEGAKLTPAEAHRWLSGAGVGCFSWDEPYRVAIEWLCASSFDLGHQTAPTLRSLSVARWLVSCWKDPARRTALEQQRVVRGPAGEEIHGRLIDRVDEIIAADLDPRNPIKCGVLPVFERAGQRALVEYEKTMAKKHEPLAALPAWWKPIRCARLLMSGAELVAEGKLMQHCVSTYAPTVKSGRSVIVSIVVAGPQGTERSTAEIERRPAGGEGENLKLQVRQHKGVRNQTPSPLSEKALVACLRHWEGKRARDEKAMTAKRLAERAEEERLAEERRTREGRAAGRRGPGFGRRW